MGKRDPRPDPDEQLGYLLVRAADQVSRQWHTDLQDQGVNPRQFSMLALIDHEPGMSQGQLARYLMITPQSVSEGLNGLRRAGLLEGEATRRGRPAQLRLTPTGRAVLDRAYPVVSASDQTCFRMLTAAQRQQLTRLLKKVLSDCPA